ncbi:MAG: hypothetical protein DRP11_03830 [Candidatus Aenigmatarchaeota archaeon]|nr:MAG: hypothetical protein DRP11_03830 [Candidatus Aenigmarchaeota archaeon]
MLVCRILHLLMLDSDLLFTSNKRVSGFGYQLHPNPTYIGLQIAAKRCLESWKCLKFKEVVGI